MEVSTRDTLIEDGADRYPQIGLVGFSLLRLSGRANTRVPKSSTSWLPTLLLRKVSLSGLCYCTY